MFIILCGEKPSLALKVRNHNVTSAEGVIKNDVVCGKCKYEFKTVFKISNLVYLCV